MYHVGQVVREIETGRALIYWGINLSEEPGHLPRGCLFVDLSKQVLPQGSVGATEPIERGDEIEVGQFCREMGFEGHFFGVIDKNLLLPCYWDLLDKTLRENGERR